MKMLRCNMTKVWREHLHAIESYEVMQLVVLDDGQEQEEKNDEGHELATVVQGSQWSCSTNLKQ